MSESVLLRIQKHIESGNTMFRTTYMDNRTIGAVMRNAPEAIKYQEVKFKSDVVPTGGKVPRYWTTVQCIERASLLASWALQRPFQKAGCLPIPQHPPVPCSPSQARAWGILRGQGGGLLTGGPGTGKTWLLQQIIKSLPQDYKVVGACPTGKAAARLEEGLLGRAKCMTLHRAMGLPGDERAIEADVVIIDESSMIDEELMASITRCVNTRNTHILFSGDVKQLAPVGPGQPFADLIANTQDCVANLDECHRFTGGIGNLASDINAGKPLNGAYEDVFFMHGDMRGYAKCKKAHDLFFNKRLHERYGVKDPKKDIMILAYTNQECDLVNRHFQEEPHKRVMFNKNNYDHNFFNGQMGILDDPVARHIKHQDGRDLYLSKQELTSYVDVAFACTIHKSQGSEWPVVILMMPDGAYEISKSLIYTAATRAKKGIVILGSTNATLCDEGRESLLDLLLSQQGRVDLPEYL